MDFQNQFSIFDKVYTFLLPLISNLLVILDAEMFSSLSVAALPPEEKEKLYQAINYSANAAPISYPAQVPTNFNIFGVVKCIYDKDHMRNFTTAKISFTFIFYLQFTHDLYHILFA